MNGRLGEEQHDILPGFKNRKIYLYRGEEATLIYKEGGFNKAVLSIHGFASYFTNEELANRYLANGYNFYAVDLRNYGRSIRDEDKRFYIDDMRSYFEELDIAVDYVSSRNNEILLSGFSMGGLISSIYLKEGFNRGKINRLFLHSPLFKFRTNLVKRIPFGSFLMGMGRRFSNFKINFNVERYKGILERFDSKGRYKHFLMKNKRIPLHLNWFKTMSDNIDKLSKGLNLEIPILVLSSTKTYDFSKETRITESDLVLDVKDIKERAPLVGENVEVRQIEGGAHDLFISAEEAKEETYTALFEWLKKNEGVV